MIELIVKKEPSVTNYQLFDDYLEAHRYIARRDDFNFLYSIREYWRRVTINGVDYYQKQYRGFDSILLTENAYIQMLKDCERKYAIHESDLVRTQRNSNCRFTGNLDSKREVIKYMRDDTTSWLPKIYAEIDEDIKSLQIKIDNLCKQKQMLQDDEYLMERIEEEISIVAKK